MSIASAKIGINGQQKDSTKILCCRVRKSVARLYLTSGILMCVVAVAVLVMQSANFDKAYSNFLFYLTVVAIAVLSLVRFKTCRLTIDDVEIFFYNGLVDVRHIQLDKIDHVEYNPEIRLRIYMRSPSKHSVIHRLPNVFSEEDTSNILGCLTTRGIRIERIEKPTPANASNDALI